MAHSAAETAEAPFSGASDAELIQREAIVRLAHATIRLSKLAPHLGALASARQAASEKQAERVRDIAAMAREMAAALGQTVQQLRASSGEIGELSTLIRRITDETRLIAINTSVAAARAGEHGRVFTVLSKEIRTLSENAAKATSDVQEKVGRLQDSARRTSHTVGLGDEGYGSNGGGLKEEKKGLAWLIERMDEADSSAAQQALEARELNTLSASLREISDVLIRTVGAFRLDAHARAERLVEALRADLDIRSGDPLRQTRVLRRAVDGSPFIELAYATDSRGTQITDNVASGAFQAAYGTSGRLRNWAQRPWFDGALRARGVYLSEIYRSAATDEYCLTASAAVYGMQATLIGVIALDVSFQRILGRVAA